VKVLGELLCSIFQLHREGMIHRDIKPENILVHHPVELRAS
jgi:serine/threonine protein kinase